MGSWESRENRKEEKGRTVQEMSFGAGRSKDEQKVVEVTVISCRILLETVVHRFLLSQFSIEVRLIPGKVLVGWGGLFLWFCMNPRSSYLRLIS